MNAPTASPMLSIFPFRRRGTLSRQQGIDLLDQLENLLTAGLPLDRALHVLQAATDSPRQRELIVTLLLGIEKGRRFSEALAEHPDLFGPFEINMVRAGEEGGVLAGALRRLVDYQLARLEFRRFLIHAAIYPCVLLVFGLVAVGCILFFVLPSFVEAYGDIASAGFPANALAALSDGLRRYGWMLGLGVLAAIVAMRLWINSPGGRLQWQSLLLALPGFGPLIVKSELSRVLHSLSVLLGAGVPILAAMRLSRALTAYRRLDQALADTERSLREGRGLARPLLANPIFPRLAGQMALVGEESGALDSMLHKVARRLENEVRSRLRALVAILEPVMIVTIGLVIGSIVVAMIAAILSLNELPL